MMVGSSSKASGVGNDTSRYEQLAFLCFGQGSGQFSDDLGVELTVGNGLVRGKGISKVLLVDCTETVEDAGVKLFGRMVAAKTAVVE